MKLTEQQRKLAQDKEEVERVRLVNVSKKVMAWMKNGSIKRTFNSWKTNVAEAVTYRRILKKFVSRMKNQKVNACYKTWYEFMQTRKWARGLLNRLLGGKDIALLSRAMKKWSSLVNTLGKIISSPKLKSKEDCWRK